MMNHQSSRSKGFTLIELLVVIAIIAILAAILFPVFAKAREKARQIACISNLKQIGLAVMQYNQDYDELFPKRNMFPNGPTWRQIVQPYIKSSGVLICPSNSADPSDQGRNDPAQLGYPSEPGGYGMNARLGNDDGNPPAASLGSINTPASKIMVGEVDVEFAANGRGWDDYGSPWWTGGGNWDCGFAGHNGMMNLLFCDGHAKSMRPTQTVSSNSAATQFNMWGGMDGGDGGKTCNNRDINCDTGDDNMLQGLRNLENYWQ